MVSHGVVHNAGDEVSPRRPALRGPHLAMVMGYFAGKCAGLPAFHSRSDYRNAVDGSNLHRDVAANGLITFAPEYLACAGYVVDTCELVVETLSRVLDIGCPYHSQQRVNCELSKQECEVVRLEGDVRIQICDHVVP